jgi:hypothetical protein
MEETMESKPSVLSVGLKFGLVIAAISVAWLLFKCYLE